MLTNVDVGKVVLFQPTSEQQATAQRRAERLNLEVVAAAGVDGLAKLLGEPGAGVLVLCAFTAEARAAARAVRAPKGLKQLPVFAIVPDEQIGPRVLKQANDQRIEVLPTSLPDSRRWEKLREALEAARAGKRWLVSNRRAHFRLPLKAKGTLLSDAETVDISEGGVAFMTNQRYSVGDTGRLDIRALLGDMDETERGFAFEVAVVKQQKQGPYRYFVGVRFVNLTDEGRQHLKTALDLIEPTEDAD
jgi:hypothetical protein